MSASPSYPSINALSGPLVERLVADAATLRLSVSQAAGGARMVDAGAQARGSIEAGRRIAEICLGGLGTVTIAPSGPIASWPYSVTVHSADPVLACLGSQYAGWSLADETGDSGFFALGSGPGRAVAAVEELYQELGFRDSATKTALVLEAAGGPPESVVAKVAEASGLKPEDLTFIFAPTQSLAGSTQVVARVLEVALHKAHTVGFDLHAIVDGIGSAPLSPPHPDFIKAMGRTNDAIIYGGRVQLFVDADDADAKQLAEQLPSTTSSDHGAPFADIFARVNGDFYKIDGALFSPAEAIVTSVRSGATYRGGRLEPTLVDASFA
ncbi:MULTISPECIES: methenyltetrahydromethanopterin cyclohydrolase [Methylobacterium]|jgi:methenyltetrahydromethanopterin cyclohydrolase|uniref:methenyltetrahydromethanopterin cyclohydrolase n=1 Tax=Methylobacterium TaxID=407 RepID=UPI00034C28CD|nr:MULTISPECIES: methenyltetrahydromethanopterin cyclohydrolase [Methylobacterium]KQS85946.1 methenyltetrahydromethanopterin cyclohydrolase [Methylobacterium sp. Leaf361]MBN4094019.1 methenyltetrahydromethanopterin cyclohydrolase [Methylobacterium sp. OT2]UIN33544.1 methenyltetrahydromethanopterin cyclohydrolase [Methylobacterium oryzae]SEG08650.1 methenyltetrahydromethanopterin cyclohydrolase [Methylobacterium sp. 190mf]SFS37816.1 methenyltetrahydromethanopterin cyclohydrolase [Methylobacteri